MLGPCQCLATPRSSGTLVAFGPGQALLNCLSEVSVEASAALQARKHAEAAVENLHGSLLHGSELKVGFGKAIPIPPQPIYPRPQHAQHLHNHMASVAHEVANSVNRKAWGRGEVDEKVMHRVRTMPTAQRI